MGIKQKNGIWKRGMKRKVLSIVVCIVALCTAAIFAACDTLYSLKNDVTIEVGTPISIDVFFENTPADSEFLTDVSGINTNEPAVYQLRIRYGKKTADVVLRIEDHTPPTANPVAKTVYMNWKMPEASECVSDVYDFSGIAKIEYKDSEPAFTAGGDFEVPVLITDVYGNVAEIKVPFTVINDVTPPVISGTHDLEVEGNPDAVDFYEGVTAKDDYDPDPAVTADDSQVDYTKTGTYTVIYRARDKAGNESSVPVMINVKLPAATTKAKTGSDNGTYHVGDGDPYALAKKVMSGLWGKDDVATARNIFNWVHDNFYFRLLSGKRVYEHAAYRGFTKKSGDCYVYYSCCKMLLDIAGIDNMRVDRYPKLNGKVHFWLLVKLNGEWYHCDATEGYKDHPGVWFMCTDAQINDRYHKFNGKLYPPRAGGSKDFLASPTPTEEITPTPSEEVTPSPTPTAAPTGEVTAVPTETQPKPTESSGEVTPSPTPVPQDTEAPAPSPSPTPVPQDTEAPAPTSVTPPPASDPTDSEEG